MVKIHTTMIENLKFKKTFALFYDQIISNSDKANLFSISDFSYKKIEREAIKMENFKCKFINQTIFCSVIL
jgi:hypothetical protein